MILAIQKEVRSGMDHQESNFIKLCVDCGADISLRAKHNPQTQRCIDCSIKRDRLLKKQRREVQKNK
jgi:RNA polymerase-binding transcription factor DksA